MLTWNYIACFIDTDGSVGIYPTKIKSKQYKFVRVAFSNTHRQVLELIKQFVKTKANVRPRNPKSYRLAKKIGYQLQIGAEAVVENILINCVPFMIIKKNHAQECLDWIRSNRRGRYDASRKLYICGGCNQWLSKENFHNERTRKYGIRNICKECRK